ncbi:MAG TPA: VCBS repeat-containing protein, partial [candidate division WOR-3 bacterium]|nr:VCBS repeat-containing protein [candidate division WOR-3 bacterium]
MELLLSFLVAFALNFSDVTGDIGIKGPAMCRDIAIADFDGDGDMDLFVASNLSNSSRLYENLGEGEFLEAEYFPGIDVTPGIKMALAVDLDADGDPDLVTVEAVEGSNLCLYLNNGQGSFEDKRGLPALPEPGSRCFLAFDFNGDSVSDLMYGDREGKLHVFDGKDSYLRDLADPMGLSHIHSVVKFFLSEGREGLTLVTMERNGMIKSFAFRNGAFYQTDESLISGALDLIPCDVNADGKVDLLVPCENGL